MDRKYWETIAPNYEEEIFDVLRNDTSGLIVSAIEQAASREKSVIDIGCAVGKWIPLLASSFKHVIAVDISATNLQIAKEKYPQFTNVDYVRSDMSADELSVTPCDVAICINAILTDSLKKRINFFQSLSISINKEGILILVVPSLESKLYTNIIANRWNVDGDHDEKIESSKKAFELANNIKQGVTDIDNVPTKHYLKEELQLLLSLEGFTVERVEKINYTWKTEFNNPPKWLQEPYPWDWMCVAKKG
ncbi:class I SAM-dependent methyltransferase [Ferruginibacter albus]|uniref:class I SAM-dependent methyltransferase n=1 Tax=Ferruginibacter albus TaxID=2875540 RepID=UPI001CC53CA6|nr:class I SAM-dependent methyltransferase [Ferruginibacter albus]UAY52452.1 class I SAM-dependent methyltransferase [Ferruginibacter albus]